MRKMLQRTSTHKAARWCNIIRRPECKKALAEAGMEDFWDTQLCVDRPWENPHQRALANAMTDLDRKFGEIMQKLDTNTHELRTKTIKQLADLIDHTNNAGTALESELVQAVAKRLEGGTIVACSYKWKEKREAYPGDVDGLVLGCMDGRRVLVVCEAKYNMSSHYIEAINQLHSNVERVEDLFCGDDEMNKYRKKDVEALKEEGLPSNLQDVTIMYALGGTVFTDDVRKHVRSKLWGRNLKSAWFRVQLDGAAVLDVGVPDGWNVSVPPAPAPSPSPA
jgi:hypothetical protein